MNEYLLINHGAGTAELWESFFHKLDAGRHLIGGSAVGDGLAVEGGVFSQLKSKTVTGYIVFRAESLEKAKEIAMECPVHQSGGTVELFPLVRS